MLLKLDNIGKIYNSDDILVVGIRGVNLEFDYNEFVTIEGESGSGKSTLLNVIGANDTYEEGELWFDGDETSHYSDEEWEKYRENNIATVFQDFNIIENLTVLENVELALFRLDDVKERHKVALDLIEKVGLTKQANQRASKLSGGEKQRTVIARALAKDSPIILADEPTGNLDVKSSREIAKLLKEVSQDKLVIVVTHNPEFFEKYATRRVRVFDGKVTEDKVVEEPKPLDAPIERKEKVTSRAQNFKNTMHIGILNYKSRPKFTAMMTFALFVCAITLFIILSIFSQGLIKDTRVTLDNVGITGKLIIASDDEGITRDELDELSHITNANYILFDKKYSEFEVVIPRGDNMLREHKVTCLFEPNRYMLKGGEAVLVIPHSMARDSNAIVKTFVGADVGITDIKVVKTLDDNEIKMYLGADTINNNAKKILAVNSGIKFGERNNRAYTFRVNEELPMGSVNVVNSVFYDALGKTIIFEAKADKAYVIHDDTIKDESTTSIIIEMNREDYNVMFKPNDVVSQACLYFSSDKLASEAVGKLPEGYMGTMSTSKLFVQNVGDVYTTNIMLYLALIAVSVLFGMLIVVIFMRSVKVYQSDFAVYKTLGISRKISSLSLYIEMAFIFLPTLVLLPLVSLIATVIPGSSMVFMSFGNYIFIELMLLFIVEMVAISFNKSINKESIRKSLKRGSK